MPLITAIEVQKKRKNRCNIFVDDAFLCGVDHEVVVKLNLKKGQTVVRDDLEQLAREEELVQAREKCLRLLDLRARTRRELADRLQRIGVEEDIIARVLDRLEEINLIDDAKYARMFIQDRLQLQGQGRHRLKNELIKRGVATDIIARALEALVPEDESVACEAAARRKVKAYRGLALPVARRRLTAFLHRKGYGFEQINTIVPKVLPQGEDSTEDEQMS